MKGVFLGTWLVLAQIFSYFTYPSYTQQVTKDGTTIMVTYASPEQEQVLSGCIVYYGDGREYDRRCWKQGDKGDSSFGYTYLWRNLNWERQHLNLVVELTVRMWDGHIVTYPIKTYVPEGDGESGTP